METNDERYSRFREPLDTWAVWDNDRDRPAEWPAPLIGLSEVEAAILCDVLNSGGRHLASVA